MPVKKKTGSKRKRTSHAGTKPPTPARIIKLFKEADGDIAEQLRLELGVEPAPSKTKAGRRRSGMPEMMAVFEDAARRAENEPKKD